MKRILSLLLLCLTLLPLAAQSMQQSAARPTSSHTDSVVVSLLTCTPGQLVYELYGHTAIRVREIREGRSSDWVFNYGTFSFKQPNFVGRFVMGKPEFELGVVPFGYFYEDYARSGRGIEEQRLNLTPDEEKRLVDALSHNLQPGNSTYTYNIFYDNCATRPLKVIAEAVDGTVDWGKADSAQTLRSMVRHYSAPSPWNRFGQDLVLGAEADEPAPLTTQMFAPLYASRFVEQAVIVASDGSKRQLAAPPVTLLPAQAPPAEVSVLTPKVVFGILLAFVVILTLAEYRTRRYRWAFDVPLYLAQGLAGCIVSFLFFFSEHPTVGSNWLVALFNPLPLLLFPWFMKHASRGTLFKGIWVQLAMVQTALLAGLCGLQQYPVEVYFILAALDIRALVHLYFAFIRRAHGTSPQ